MSEVLRVCPSVLVQYPSALTNRDRFLPLGPLRPLFDCEAATGWEACFNLNADGHQDLRHLQPHSALPIATRRSQGPEDGA